MKNTKRILAAVLALLLLAVPCLAAEGVTSGTGTVGSYANLVYVDMTDHLLVPLIANGSIHTDAQTSQIIADSGYQVAAAINGGFFNSYYNANKPMGFANGNYAQVFSTIVRNGQPVNAGGTIPAIGQSYDGSVYIDRVKLTPTVTMRGETVVSCWSVNVPQSDAAAIYALTDALDYPVDLPASSKVVKISGQRVQSVTGGTAGYVTPDGWLTLVYNETAYANAAKWNQEPLVGDLAVFHYSVTPENTANQAAWEDMCTVVAGGGVLVLQGANVVDSNNIQQENQKPDVTGQRSFAALLKDGRLVLGTVNSTLRRIADDLITMGATDAIFMDGGGSSMLYCDGKFLTSPGRKLATVLAVAENAQMPARPSLGEGLVPELASSWAQPQIDRARELGILPAHLDKRYVRNITRQEFCDLIAAIFRAKTGMSIEYFCSKQELTVDPKVFPDCTGYYVPYVAALGIVTGYADGTFGPNDEITREQAAIILQRMAKVMGAEAAGTPISFADAAAVSSWAKAGVDFVSALRIMNGSTDGNFNPAAYITREQAVITMINTWNAL